MAVGVAATAEIAEYRPSDRDHALRRVASWTTGGISGAVVLTGALSVVSAASFAVATSSSSAPSHVPGIPPEAAPVQSAPPSPLVIVRVVHVPASPGNSYARSSRIAPPRKAPSAGSPPPPPAPPPPPVCHSTPSHPC